MILTGKAKEDFSYKYNMSNFNEYSEVLQNALIIEFFDSVGICIEIDVSRFNDKYGFDCGFYYDNFNDYIAIDGFFNSRQEATEQAIIKANDIYNENKE